FDDARARRALAYAIDRAAVVRLVGGAAAATPTCQMIPPGSVAYRAYCPYTLRPSGSGVWTAPDLPRARRLVAASGTAGDRVVVWTFSNYAVVGRYVTTLLRGLGYRATLRIVRAPGFFGAVMDSRNNWQVSIRNFVLSYTDARNILDS